MKKNTKFFKWFFFFLDLNLIFNRSYFYILDLRPKLLNIPLRNPSPVAHSPQPTLLRRNPWNHLQTQPVQGVHRVQDKAKESLIKVCTLYMGIISSLAQPDVSLTRLHFGNLKNISGNFERTKKSCTMYITIYVHWHRVCFMFEFD